MAIDWYKNINRKFEDPDTSDLFLKNGNEFKVTDKFRNLGLLETFKSIADEGFDGFYNGWVAKDIHEKLQSIGGSHTLNDFKNAKAEWVKPITGNYRNITIHECPPNGQGIVAVFILSILERFNLRQCQKLIICIYLLSCKNRLFFKRSIFVRARL